MPKPFSQNTRWPGYQLDILFLGSEENRETWEAWDLSELSGCVRTACLCPQGRFVNIRKRMTFSPIGYGLWKFKFFMLTFEGEEKGVHPDACFCQTGAPNLSQQGGEYNLSVIQRAWQFAHRLWRGGVQSVGGPSWGQVPWGAEQALAGEGHYYSDLES